MIKKILRGIIAVIAVIFLIWFITPVGWGIWHIGNMVGIVLCLVILFRVCFVKLYRHIKQVMSARRATKILLRIVQIVATFVIVYCTLITAVMVSAMIPRDVQDDATAIVLGAQVKRSGPSALLRQRINAAEKYLNEHPRAAAVVTGGQGDNEPISEAKSMYDNMVRDGIDPDRIYQEDQAKNTYENIRFSLKIVEKENLNRDVVIVTDSYHQLRARIIAYKNDAELKISPVNTSTLSHPAAIAAYPSYFVREWIAIPVEILK